MKISTIFRSLAVRTLDKQVQLPMRSSRMFSRRGLCADQQEMKEFLEYMDNLKNYEKSGVPENAGTDSDDGFDLGRMRRLLHHLGNPQCKFKAVHIAGTKGKGSTAAFLSSILRTEGYSVGCYTSPHLWTIRERITLGRSGEPVSAEALNYHFLKIKLDLEKAVELENGHLSYFEVFTAIAFSLFAEEKVDLAVIEAGLGGARDATNVITSSGLAASIITNIGEEHLAALGGSVESIAVAKSGIIKDGRPLILGGPFLPHIERILRDKASFMAAPVVSASSSGNKSMLKGFSTMGDIPHQLCDILLHIEKDLPLFIDLFDVKLRLLGCHQLQNAATATCAALSLRDQGWSLSDESIRAGLECAFLLGRNQFLTTKEVEMLGVPGAIVLLDGAHTKGSAQALSKTIKMIYPEAKLVFVVAMAKDKDHLGFARELLSVGSLEAAFFTEVDIAGDNFRTMSSSKLKDYWMQACRDMGSDFVDCEVAEYELIRDQYIRPGRKLPILFAVGSLVASIKAAGHNILGGAYGKQNGIIVVTGSLHVVSAVLGSLGG